MNHILDACALLAFLNDEEGADKIEELLNLSATGNISISISMSIVDLLEVYYGELRDEGADVAQIVLDVARHYSIKIIHAISEQAFREAARLKAVYRISIADCIGLATAVELSSQFVSSDHHELDVIAMNKPIPIFWFR